MKANRLSELLAAYGVYHRDPRNRLTHYVGVPLIVYALLVALALGVWREDRIAVAALIIFYLYLDLRLALALALILTLLAALAEATTRLGTSHAILLATAIFVAGWALQLLGHRLEGNRPALLDNLLQILIAPIYLLAELAFALSLRPALRTDLERRLDAAHAGATHARP